MCPGLTPAVVVIAYNRPLALERLLVSLARAEYPPGVDVPLIVSVDRSEDNASAAVARAARTFNWLHGAKTVIEQEKRLGLVAHFHACGRLSARYGSVILLEDDLVVAPPYYDFAASALARYEDEPRVAGVCLYGLWFNGFSHDPFLPLEDGTDTFLLKLPYTQGLAFTAAQWQRSEEWSNGHSLREHPDLHPSFLRFGREEWFPKLACYLASQDRYVCFPRVSLTVGWGDAGTHFAASSAWFQTPVQLQGRPYRFTDLDGLSVYDSFYELLPDRLLTLAPHLPPIDFDVDLNATKQPFNLRHGYVLTSRPVRRSLMSFGLVMYPPELNIALSVPGDALSFARREDVYWDAWAETEARRRLHAYFWARNHSSRKRDARFAVAKLVQLARERLPWL